MGTNFEEAVNELKLLKTIDDDTILDISEKYNLSVLELDKLYTVATEQMIVGKSGYCGFDQKKICDVQCKYYSSCTRKSNSIEDDKPLDSIGAIFDSYGYAFLGLNKKKQVYANNKGSYLYVDDSNRLKVYIHPKYNDVLDEKDFSKKIVVGDDMPEFPEQESGYAGIVYHGLSVELKGEDQLKSVLSIIENTKIDYSEKKKLTRKLNTAEKNQRVAKKDSCINSIENVTKVNSNYKKNERFNTAYTFEEDIISIDTSVRTRVKEYEADADQDVSKIMLDLGLTYISTEHRCNHYVLDDPYMDIYYLSREKTLVFHPEKERAISLLGIDYRKLTNYYLREFPAQVTGYGDSIYSGIGVKVWDKDSIMRIMHKVIGRSVENISHVGTEDRKSPNLSAWISNEGEEKDSSSDGKKTEVIEANKEIAEDTRGGDTYQEKLLEEYKKWLRKESFSDRIIVKHEKAIREMNGLSVLDINDYDELLEKTDAYCRNDNPVLFVRTVLKYYVQFFYDRTQNELGESVPDESEEEKSKTYKEKYYDDFFEYLKEKTGQERDSLGKKHYSDGVLRNMATDAFYLEKYAEEDFLSWFGTEEALERARVKCVKLFSGRRVNPEEKAKYFIEAMKYLNDYLRSVNVVTMKNTGSEAISSSGNALENSFGTTDKSDISQRLSYSDMLDLVGKRKCASISPLVLDSIEITKEQNAELWAKALLCKDLKFVTELSSRLPVSNVEKVIECLQNESVVSLCGILPQIEAFFEKEYKTNLLSELTEWAQEEYEEEREYIQTVMVSLEREFERKMHDAALGRIDPDGYSVDPDYDSAFDVNHDDGIAFKKVMEYDRFFRTKARKADSLKLVEMMMSEGLNVSCCKPGYINTLLERNYKYRERSYSFSETERACLDLIIQNGYDINKIDEAGFTLLRFAVRANNIDATKYLIDKGADPYAGVMAIHEPYADKLIKKGIPQELFSKEGNGTVRYLGADGIMFQAAFGGYSDMLVYLDSVVGGSQYFSLLSEIADNATDVFTEGIAEIRQKWMGKKLNEFYTNV